MQTKHPLVIILFLAAFNISQAQLYIGLHGGVTLPTGYYAESRMSDHEWMLIGSNQLKAGAGRGFFGGLDINFPMPFHNNLELFVAAEYMQGQVNTDIEKYYERMSGNYSPDNQHEIILPRFRNIPVMLGVRYDYPIAPYYDLFGEAAAGINFRTVTLWQESFTTPSYINSDGQSFSNYKSFEQYQYANATTFAFRIGAGILIRKMVSLGAYYTVLGKTPLQWDHTRTSTYTTPAGVREVGGTKHVTYTALCPTMVCITLGFRINPFKGLSRHVQDA